MKDVVVILKLKVKDDAPIDHVVNDIQADVYGCIEEVVSVEAHELVKKSVIPEDDPSDVCVS